MEDGFWSSIGMVELKGLDNSNGKVSWVPVRYTIKQLILHQKTTKGK